MNGTVVDAPTIIYYVLSHFIQEYCELVLNEINNTTTTKRQVLSLVSTQEGSSSSLSSTQEVSSSSLSRPPLSSQESPSPPPPPYETILKQTATLVTFAFSKLFNNQQDSIQTDPSNNNLAILTSFYESRIPPPPPLPLNSNVEFNDPYANDRKVQQSATYLLQEFKPKVLKLLQELIIHDDYSLRDSACISLCSYIADMNLVDMMNLDDESDFILNIIHACEKHVENFVRYSMLISAITDKLQFAISSCASIEMNHIETRWNNMSIQEEEPGWNTRSIQQESTRTKTRTSLSTLLSNKYSPHFNRLFKHLFEKICVNRLEKKQHALEEEKKHSQFVVCLFDAFYDSLDFMKYDTNVELIETFLLYARENILKLIHENSKDDDDNDDDNHSSKQLLNHSNSTSSSTTTTTTTTFTTTTTTTSLKTYSSSDEISAFSTCINAIIRNTDRPVLLKLFEKHDMFIFLTQLLRMCSNHSNLRIRDCAVHTIGNMSNADLFDLCPFDVQPYHNDETAEHREVGLEKSSSHGHDSNDSIHHSKSHHLDKISNDHLIIIPQDSSLHHDLLYDFVLPLLERESMVSPSFYQEATLEDDATLKKKIIVYHNAVWSLGRVILNIQRKKKSETNVGINHPMSHPTSDHHHPQTCHPTSDHHQMSHASDNNHPLVATKMTSNHTTTNTTCMNSKFNQFLERISPKLMNIIRLFANRDFFTTEDVIEDITGYLSNVCITISYISFSRIDFIAPYFPLFGDSFIEHVQADSSEDLDEEKMAMCVAIFRMTEYWLNQVMMDDEDENSMNHNNNNNNHTTTMRMMDDAHTGGVHTAAAAASEEDFFSSTATTTTMIEDGEFDFETIYY
ncbi:hypothetical protein C9374_008134 [Naegleria lovaniensis]|uniref:Uncharacterized protein n=1 Tax=Naegleria lovaniensis TaxID=51637 RepID=A0AA88GJZ4_NAELO|nr:uncharacterized protein C9374_008134 [Naegleria lovaniensis]KAG2378495.1 hypothetical protein C9374_008134 [Naegleria lovaniensis]